MSNTTQPYFTAVEQLKANVGNLNQLDLTRRRQVWTTDGPAAA